MPRDEEKANRDRLAAKLDAVHKRAKEAFVAKDLAAYMTVFSPELEYIQANGQSIDRSQLSRDVQLQMTAATSMDGSYDRKSLDVEGDEATELLIQSAWVETRAFFFFRRRWNVSRTGRYHWANTLEGWKIAKVEVLEEQIW